MLILIPVNGTDKKRSVISTLSDLTHWAVVDFDKGVSKSVRFFTDRTLTGEDWIDFVVLKNKFENYMNFMEEGMMVLVVREEETLEDIMEAFKFKELDEIGF